MLLGAPHPYLRPYRDVLRDHFGEPGLPFAVQRVDFGDGRVALIVSRQDGEDPVLLVIDGGHLAWSKPSPAEGLPLPFAELALAPWPKDHVALFGYGPASHGVTARFWAEDGTPGPDAQVESCDACETLSATYGRGFGWIVACESSSGVHAQRIDEDRRAVWGEQGAGVGAANAVGPVTIVFDTPNTWVLIQRAKMMDADHVLVFRYDARGQPLWSAPADLGVPHGRLRAGRLEATAERAGVTRIDLPAGLVGKRAKAAEVAPDGGVRILAP